MTSPVSENNANQTSHLSPSSASLPVKEDTPRMQATFLYGVFGTDVVLIDEEKLAGVQKHLRHRIRPVVTNNGGQFQDLGLGRFSATLGAQNSTEEDPLTAVTIGLKLLQQSAVSRKLPPLRLVAVTGRIAAGSLQLSQKAEDESSLHGHELLSRALRIMEECPPGALYVDGLTYRMIRSSHQCNRVEAPSQALPVAIYEVISAHEEEAQERSLPLIGRQKELDRLSQVFERVAVGEGPVFMTVTGDLGIGKTHLLQAFLDEVGEHAQVFYNRRQRRRIDRWRRTPYSYFGEVLRAGFGISEHEDAATSLDKLFLGLLSTLPPEVEQVPQEFATALGLLCYMEMPEVDELLRERELRDIEQEAFSAFGRYLEAISQHKPVVFALDDLYSADPSSLRLFRHLMSHLDSMPVLFVFSSRLSLLKEMESESDFQIPGECITLKPLSRSASEQLFTQLLPDGLSVNFPLARRILDISDGNPFFLQESIRELSEQRALGESSNIEIPGSIEGILQSRLSRLSRTGKTLLNYASIFGKIFWRGGIEMLHRRFEEMEGGWRIKEGVITERDDDLKQELRDLVNQGLIREQEESLFEGETQYVFVPGLLQELVYQELTRDTRIPCHRLVAQWLKVVSHRSTVNVDADIAFHSEEGELPFKAARFHLQFGTHLIKINEPLRAIEHLEKSLKLMAEDSESKRVEAHRELAEAYIVAGRYDESLQQLDRVLELSWELGSRVVAGEAYTRQGWVLFLARNFSEALIALKNGHTLHQACNYERGIAMALSNMGKVYTVLGDYKQAELYLQEALMLRRDLGQAGDVAWTLNDMANLLVEKGELRKAMTCHKEALELRKALSKPQLIIQSMSNMSALHMMLGEDDAALADLLVSSNLAQKLGDKLSIAVVTVNIGELYLLRGETTQAERYLRQATAIAEKLDDKLIIAECYRLMGELSLETGEADDALEFSHRSFALVKDFDIGSALAGTYRLMGEVYAVVPQEALQQFRSRQKLHPELPTYLYGDALACLEESITVARQHGNLREEAKSRMVLGLFEVNRGRIRQGRRELEQSCEAFGKLGMERYHAEVAELINDVLLYQKQSEESEEPEANEAPRPSEEVLQTRESDESKTSDSLQVPKEKPSLLPVLASVEETVQIKVDFDALEAEFNKELKREEESAEEKDDPRNEETVESTELDSMATQILQSPRPSRRQQEAKSTAVRKPIKVERGTPVHLPTVTPEKADEVINRPVVQRSHTPTPAQTPPVVKPVPAVTPVAAKKPPFPPLVVPVAPPPVAAPVAPPSTGTPALPQPAVPTPPSQELTAPKAPVSPITALPVTKKPQLPVATENTTGLTKAVELSNLPPVRTTPTELTQPLSEDNADNDDDTSTQIVESPRRRQNPLSPLASAQSNPFDSSANTAIAVEESSEEEEQLASTPLEEDDSKDWENKTVRLKAEDLLEELEELNKEEEAGSEEASSEEDGLLDLGSELGSEGKVEVQPEVLSGSVTETGTQTSPHFTESDDAPEEEAVSVKLHETNSDGEGQAADVNFLEDDLSVELGSQDEPTLAGGSVDVDVRPDPSVPQTPSVYDSQVIIAQVAEDDPISRDWFEQGRSDRVDQFWRSNSEEVEKVKEEIRLEQMIHEIDKHDKHKGRKKN